MSDYMSDAWHDERQEQYDAHKYGGRIERPGPEELVGLEPENNELGGAS